MAEPKISFNGPDPNWKIPENTSYICLCCGCEFKIMCLSLDIFVIDDNGKIVFQITEDELTDGSTWEPILPRTLDGKLVSNYGDFANGLEAALQENPDNHALRHLVIKNPILPKYKNYKLEYEYIR